MQRRHRALRNRYAVAEARTDGDDIADRPAQIAPSSPPRRGDFACSDARISVASDFPVSAGLGGSSAVGVATVAAFAALRGQRMSPSAIAELSREIEIGDVGIPGGRQDHYAAAYGGALGLRFSAAGVDVRAIPLSEKFRSELERRCLHRLHGTEPSVGRDDHRGDARVCAIESRASSTRSRECARSPKKWRRRSRTGISTASRRSSPSSGCISARCIRRFRLLSSTTSSRTPKPPDAIGAKALGASGGGCVLVMARADRVDAVRKSVESLGECCRSRSPATASSDARSAKRRGWSDARAGANRLAESVARCRAVRESTPSRRRWRSVLDAWGFRVEVVDAAPGRPNVIARIGTPGARTLMFNGHLDVVGVDGMTHDPWSADANGQADRIYGRGSSDMKAGIAAMCAAAARAERARAEWRNHHRRRGRRRV